MKFLVLFAVVASAAATNLVTYPNGAVAPAETPEVQAAKAAHFAAKGAYAYAAHPYAYGAHPYAYNNYAYGAYPYAYGAYPYNYAFGGLVAHPNGAVVPVDEPAVVAAKAEHFAAKGLPVAPVAAAVAPVAAYAPYAANYAYAGLVAHPNGALVPVEPADVVAARAEHLAAHA